MVNAGQERIQQSHSLHRASQSLAAAEQDLLISHAIDRLSLYANSGRIGRQRQTRELVITHTPFIAVYRISPDLDEVHILRILHSSQKWPPQ